MVVEALKIPMDSLPELETSCLPCKGKGGYSDVEDDGFAKCPYCHGSGFVPTDFGKQILSLVQHNARLAVRPELLFSAA